RDVVQKYRAEKFEKELRYDVSALIGRSDDFRKVFEENARKMEPFQNRLLTGSPILALWDRGDPSPTYIYRKGDPQKPGKLVGPRGPSALPDRRTRFWEERPCPAAQ